MREWGEKELKIEILELGDTEPFMSEKLMEQLELKWQIWHIIN